MPFLEQNKITRRRFLAVAAYGLAALPFLSFVARAAARPVWYCAITPESDDLTTLPKMDMGWVEAEDPKTISIPELGDDYFLGRRTLLTLVDELGSNVRRLWVPGLLHTGTFSGDNLLLVTRGESPVFYALNINTQEITAYAIPDKGFLFGGHIIPWAQSHQIAITVNKQQAGAYDRVDIYDSRSLKKLDSFNSYGFQAHELALTPDKKTLYVGHYGAYYTSGPYRDLAPDYQPKLRVAPGAPSITHYPGSVSVIDLKSRALTHRLADTRNGAQGHLAPSIQGQVFLTRLPPLLASRTDTMINPAYAEGTDHKICPQELYDASHFISSGTTVVVDHKQQQFLLACTPKSAMGYGSLKAPDNMKYANLSEAEAFKSPCGIAFHPDGHHYIVSCKDGFSVMTRGTHISVADRAIPIRLDWHSHMCVG